MAAVVDFPCSESALQTIQALYHSIPYLLQGFVRQNLFKIFLSVYFWFRKTRTLLAVYTFSTGLHDQKQLSSAITNGILYCYVTNANYTFRNLPQTTRIALKWENIRKRTSSSDFCTSSSDLCTTCTSVVRLERFRPTSRTSCTTRIQVYPSHPSRIRVVYDPTDLSYFQSDALVSKSYTGRITCTRGRMEPSKSDEARTSCTTRIQVVHKSDELVRKSDELVCFLMFSHF